MHAWATHHILGDKRERTRPAKYLLKSCMFETQMCKRPWFESSENASFSWESESGIEENTTGERSVYSVPCRVNISGGKNLAGRLCVCICVCHPSVDTENTHSSVTTHYSNTRLQLLQPGPGPWTHTYTHHTEMGHVHILNAPPT